MADAKNSRADQGAAVPFRHHDGELVFCLITTSDGRNWGVPKGMIDPGNNVTETALQEAHEEAGLYGEIVGPAVTSYTYKKWGARLVVEVYLMKVTGMDDEWDEMHIRQRRRCDGETALDLVANRPVAAALAQAIRQVQALVSSAG